MRWRETDADLLESSKGPVCRDPKQEERDQKSEVLQAQKACLKSFCGCLLANMASRKKMTALQGNHLEPEGPVCILSAIQWLWAGAHLLWFHSPLCGRSSSRTQSGEVPSAICNHLNGESWGRGEVMTWGAGLQSSESTIMNTMFKRGEFAFPQMIFKHSHIIESESKNCSKSSTFHHWHSCIEKSTRASKGNEKTH